MPTVQAPVQLTVEHLMAAVQQLSPAELREFMQQLTMWQANNGVPADQEAGLLACIKANSHLPPTVQRRFERLRRKRQTGKLTAAEEAELQGLWQRVEHMNATRLEALSRWT